MQRLATLKAFEKLKIIVPCAVIAVLVIALCITAAGKTSIHNEYTDARNTVGEELFRNLYLLEQTYTSSNLTGVDVQSTVLPTIRNYFNAANALDVVLGEAFGKEYRVLGDGVGAALESAINEFSNALRQGRSTDAAIQNMNACMETLATIRSTRFGTDGTLIPLKK